MWSGFTTSSNCAKVTVEARFQVVRGKTTFQVKGMVSPDPQVELEEELGGQRGWGRINERESRR